MYIANKFQKVLDELCPDRPLLIWHRSFHEIYLNRQMLLQIRIMHSSPIKACFRKKKNQNQSILTKSFYQKLFSAALDNLDFEDEDAVRAHHQVEAKTFTMFTILHIYPFCTYSCKCELHPRLTGIPVISLRGGWR